MKKADLFKERKYHPILTEESDYRHVFGATEAWFYHKHANFLEEKKIQLWYTYQ